MGTLENVQNATRKALAMRTQTELESAYLLIRDELAQVEEKLTKAVSKDLGTLNDALAYLLGSEGKRLRPAILILVAKACGLNGSGTAVKMATAAELFHTATLVTDDILDCAVTRRGQQTVNDRWGTDTAVLSAQYLYLSALSISSRIKGNGNVSDYSEVILDTARSMLTGEIKDIEAGKSRRLQTEQEYISMVRDKTGVLFSACSRVGALLADAESGILNAMSAYGENLGIAFQIVDDVLDIIANEDLLGKALGTDFRMGRMTLPLIRHLRVSDRKSRRKFVESLARGKGELKSLRFSLERSGSIDYSLDRARQYASAARRSLDILGESAYKKSLKALSRYAVQREM